VRVRFAAALAAAALLAGCGGEDEPRESKADFIAAGDKICLERDTRSAKLETAVGDDRDVGRLTGELAAIYADSIARLQALELPRGAARSGADRYIRSVAAMRLPVQRMKAASDDLAAAAVTQRADKVRTIAKQLQINVNAVFSIGELADQNARAYGFKNCGQQQGGPPVS